MSGELKYVTQKQLENEKLYDKRTQRALEYFRSTPYHLLDKKRAEKNENRVDRCRQ